MPSNGNTVAISCLQLRDWRGRPNLGRGRLRVHSGTGATPVEVLESTGSTAPAPVDDPTASPAPSSPAVVTEPEVRGGVLGRWWRSRLGGPLLLEILICAILLAVYKGA